MIYQFNSIENTFKDKLEEIFREKGFVFKSSKDKLGNTIINKSAVYRACGMQKKTFENLFDNNPEHEPSKKIILQLVIGLKLPLEKAEEVIHLAGFHLSPLKKFDCIVKKYLENENYDFFEINEELYKNNLPNFDFFSLGFEKVA